MPQLRDYFEPDYGSILGAVRSSEAESTTRVGVRPCESRMSSRRRRPRQAAAAAAERRSMQRPLAEEHHAVVSVGFVARAAAAVVLEAALLSGQKEPVSRHASVDFLMASLR